MTPSTESKVGMRDVLAVGVVLVEYFGMGEMRLTKIVRHTPTQAITASGRKYRLSDGHQVGDYGSAVVATDAHYAEMHHRNLMRRVAENLPSMAALKSMSDDRLSRLLAILTDEPKSEAR